MRKILLVFSLFPILFISQTFVSDLQVKLQKHTEVNYLIEESSKSLSLVFKNKSYGALYNFNSDFIVKDSILLPFEGKKITS